MPECAYKNRILNMGQAYLRLNLPKFWVWQGSKYASITQHSEYARMCLDRVLNISRVINMLGFSTWQGSEYVSDFKYVRDLNIHKYETILNMQWNAIIEGFWIFQDSKNARFLIYKCCTRFWINLDMAE